MEGMVWSYVASMFPIENEFSKPDDNIATPNKDGNINTNGSSMIANDFLYILVFFNEIWQLEWRLVISFTFLFVF